MTTPTLRRAAGAMTDAACRAAGRRNVVRAARFVLNWARLDVPNEMSANGETALQEWLLDLWPTGEMVQVLDVGANVGRWSVSMLDVAGRHGRSGDLDLHAFEPSEYTFARLSAALEGRGVTVRRAALSDEVGSARLHVVGPGAGTNSLDELPMSGPAATTETVPTTTLDAYAAECGLDRIGLLKIDTEGHDVAVLRGAAKLLADQRIEVVQFEYNHRWIYARAFLRDAFSMLVPFGYRLGKLTPQGVEFYPEWDSDLETFIEGNYVACTSAVAERLPSVAWWKSGIGEGSSCR